MSSLQQAALASLRAVAALGAAATLITACSGGSLTPATAPGAARGLGAPSARVSHAGFQFTTLDDQSDPTFNQLLGINDHGKIAGYFGIGTLPSHPNKGYVLLPPYGQGNYVNENFPGSVQTQVTSINTRGDTAGFWADGKNVDRGWISWNGVFTSYTDPHTGKGTANQILGINDNGIAVGFYTDASGLNHGFKLDQHTGKFTAVRVPGALSLQATGINDAADITGLYTTAPSGPASSFLIKRGRLTALSFPGGSNTQSLGINNHDQMVGSYLDGGGVMHGFLLSDPLGHAKWESIDDPNGVGTTVVNGLNDKNQMVGFYTDGANNVDGMLITP